MTSNNRKKTHNKKIYKIRNEICIVSFKGSECLKKVKKRRKKRRIKDIESKRRVGKEKGERERKER